MDTRQFQSFPEVVLSFLEVVLSFSEIMLSFLEVALSFPEGGWCFAKPSMVGSTSVLSEGDALGAIGWPGSRKQSKSSTCEFADCVSYSYFLSILKNILHILISEIDLFQEFLVFQ